MVKTNKQQWNHRHGFKLNESHSREEISKTSKVPRKVIQEVYDRGVGAHKTNPASVYSFVNKLEGRAKLNHDIDLV